jgi:lysylphosphatidylglycerol synthetase-like protein (DUF2156 family)
MALVGTIVVAVALLIGLGNGLRRGTIKESIALVGVLLGALLVSLWAERWGIIVAQRTGWKSGTSEWLAALVLLWVSTLFTGYGGAALLPGRAIRLTPAMRAGGALLGLLNWCILVALSLRYTQMMLYRETETPKPTWIRDAVASRFLLDRFDLLLLSLAGGVAVVALVTILVRLLRGLNAAPTKPPTPTVPTRPTTGATAATTSPSSPIFRDSTAQSTPPGMERSFIEKPRPPSGGG